MGLSCKLNMIRWGIPSLHSPFTTTSFPPCSSPSIRGKELDIGMSRLPLLTVSIDESETLQKDSFRSHVCSSLASQTVENDYPNLELIMSRRSWKGLHNMISDTGMPLDEDTSAYVRSIQACSASNFRALMENIKILESTIADSNISKLESDILAHLGRLGALELFYACLSRTIADPTFTRMSNPGDQLIEDRQTNERLGNDFSRKVVSSKKKQERKYKQQKRFKAATEKCRCKSASSEENFVHPSVSSSAKKTKLHDKRVMFAKNEAELSKGIKVVAKLEKVKEAWEKTTGREVTLSCWAEAAGIDEKKLQHDLHFGWFCRDELLRSGRSLVLYLSRNYRGLGVAHEDLIQAGNLGILQGAERFDDTRGYQFSTYVQYWIRKTMSQLVSRHGRGIKVPLTLSTAMNRIQRARKDFRRSHGKHPDDVDVAKLTGLSLDKIKSVDRCLRIVGSIDQKVGNNINVKFMELTPDTTIEMPEITLMKQHMRNDIIKLLNDLDPKERRVLIRRYGFGGHCMSLHEIGKIFKVSKEWIRRMEKKALIKLKKEEIQKSLRHYMNL